MLTKRTLLKGMLIAPIAAFLSVFLPKREVVGYISDVKTWPGETKFTEEFVPFRFNGKIVGEIEIKAWLDGKIKWHKQYLPFTELCKSIPTRMIQL